MVFIQTGMEEIPHTCTECELSGKSLALSAVKFGVTKCP